MGLKQGGNVLHKHSLEGEYIIPKGIPGFEKMKEFRLQPHNELFGLLISIQEPDQSFIVVNPFDFVQDYEFELSNDDLEELEITSREQLAVRSIVTWHSDYLKSTVNLLAPLVFNMKNRRGKQLILQNTRYTTKHLLWPREESPDKGGGI